MEEATTQTTIRPDAQTVQPPAVEQRHPSLGKPAAIPAPSSAPRPSAAPATSVSSTVTPAPASAPQGPEAPREPIAPAAAPSVPSMTARPPAASAASATAHPTVPAPPPTAGHQQSHSTKKRKLEISELQNSTYFKIRATVRDLRPAFIEVLHTPDFRNCKAADDIRTRMKMLLELAKQLEVEAVPSGRKTAVGQSSAEESKQAKDVVIERALKPDGALDSVPTQEAKAPVVPEETISEARGLEKHQGSYIVGGSPMGWNFLFYRGSQPVYYGVTKEAARSRRSIQKLSDD